MRRVPVLVGDGGHARDIAAVTHTLRKFRHHLDYAAWVRSWADNGINPVILGINNPTMRAGVAEELGVEDAVWVHSHTFIGPDCPMDYGTHINYGVTMTRTTIGHHCTIAPGVTICGDVTIGNRVFVGAGAVIVNLTTVPDDTFIKAGTVWTGR